ncbi:uncharacterized protein LOC120209646 [Hibiscus syriacus]|uniref:uncharacterized protein LOC120209646 n=1 Tax=Hibiscus syriacus TaxID=106335 RepID=UPI001922192E|nr:uncharacterized protein LOC120209646 [Hibiscus syriacus]XP_039064523.1 uncharacterized protein LOC120209646 [Hibiscus syriacus]XP_039064525.1 uncharacterized protein LOC120209646 [Hibiscus syriacus]
MLVLSMNNKRQRRPNVRLGEIGDASAAFACGFSQNTREILVKKRWKPDFPNSHEHELASTVDYSKGMSSGFLNSNPGISTSISADLQQNIGNKNPNSSKLGFDLITAGEIDMMKATISFGTVTRKSRVMKRRGRSQEANNSVFLCSAWTQSSEVSPEFSSDERKEYGEEKQFMGIKSNDCVDHYLVNDFQDISDHDAPATSKDACEYNGDETRYESLQQGNADDCWKDDCYQGDNVLLRSSDDWDRTGYTSNDGTSVKRWLEELRFGRYASIFEMHEVDEEALPLLTLDDLKEMGVFAAGHRRKLYTAIQQLREGDVSS